MKRIGFAICLVFLSLFFASCHKEEKAAKQVAENYLQAMQKGDFTDAKNFVVAEDVEIVNILQAMSETTGVVDSTPCIVEEVEIVNDTSAKVLYSKALPDQSNDTLVMKMKKRGNEWKVVPTKEDQHLTDLKS